LPSRQACHILEALGIQLLHGCGIRRHELFLGFLAVHTVLLQVALDALRRDLLVGRHLL